MRNNSQAAAVILDMDGLMLNTEHLSVVEDSELGVQAALSAGMKVFLVPGFGAPSRIYDPRRVTVVQRLGVVLDWLRAA